MGDSVKSSHIMYEFATVYLFHMNITGRCIWCILREAASSTFKYINLPHTKAFLLSDNRSDTGD